VGDRRIQSITTDARTTDWQKVALVSSILDPYTSILLCLNNIQRRGCTDGDGMMEMETGVMKNR
jgi:hypothetical protein